MAEKHKVFVLRADHVYYHWDSVTATFVTARDGVCRLY